MYIIYIFSYIIRNTFLYSYSNTYLLFQVYKQKTENAKREYLRELAAYRASLVSNGPNGQNHNARSKPY